MSPPFALDAAITDGVSSTALLKFPTGLGAASRLSFRAKVKPSASCADGATLVTLSGGDSIYTVALGKVAARSTLHVTGGKFTSDAGPFLAGDATNTITFDGWTDLDIDVKVAAGTSDAGGALNDVEIKWGGQPVSQAMKMRFRRPTAAS